MIHYLLNLIKSLLTLLFVSSCLTKVDSNNKMHYNGNELNTFTFAKWTSDQVYEWLNRNGFENYFSFSSDGRCHHKWIKNGLHLLQASQQEYEKVFRLMT